jgi:hypothetical protein
VWNVFDHGRLTNQVLVQDARFQQLYEQYQDVVLRAARELDDAASGFAYTRAQVGILRDAVQAARRSLDIATVQYREGLVDFQRVLDSQRALFSAQEGLVASQGGVVQYLIAVYKAMGGGWQAGRSRPVLDDATQATMGERSDWKSLLQAPCRRRRKSFCLPHERHAMSQDPPSQPPSTSPAAARTRPRPSPGRAARARPRPRRPSAPCHRRADRRQPRAVLRRRPAHAEHLAGAGAGLRRAGGRRSRRQGAGRAHPQQRSKCSRARPCSTSTRSRTASRWCAARADLESVRSSIKGSVAGVEAARASLAVSEASRDMAERDASRLEKLHARIPARSRCAASRSRRPRATRRAARWPRAGRPAQGAGGRRRSGRRERAAAQRGGGGREGRARSGAHAQSSRRRAAWSPTCAPTSALRAARRPGDDADRDARPVDQRRPDREQHRPCRPGDRWRSCSTRCPARC